MKFFKILKPILIILCVATLVYAAGVATYTEDTSPNVDSLFYTVRDPSGTPLDRKVTLKTVKTLQTSESTLVDGEYDPVLLVSDKVAGQALVRGDVIYIGSNGKYYDADADQGCSTACTNSPAYGIVVAATCSTDNPCDVMRIGSLRLDAYNWLAFGTIAGKLYLSTTPATLTATAPTGSGHSKHHVCDAVSDDVVECNFLHPAYLNP